MKRHYCIKCKAKRFEKFMKELDVYTSNGKPKWICSDEFCGDAESKMYGLLKPLSMLQHGQARSRR